MVIAGSYGSDWCGLSLRSKYLTETLFIAIEHITLFCMRFCKLQFDYYMLFDLENIFIENSKESHNPVKRFKRYVIALDFKYN